MNHQSSCVCGASKYPTFGVINGRAQYCKSCIPAGSSDIVDVKHKMCPTCGRRPSHNLPGVTPALYCAKHALPGMENVISRVCEHDGCKRRPSFNRPGTKSGIFCVKHKSPDMINVNSPNCEHRDGDVQCEKMQPHFNVPGEKRGKYCNEHRLPGMINVVSPKCIFEGCMKHRTFNTPDQKQPLYCSEHKLAGMVNKNKKCIGEDDGKPCTTEPTYNFNGLKTRL